MNKLKKIAVICCALIVALVGLSFPSLAVAGGVSLMISAPSTESVVEGGTVTFELIYSGDIIDISLLDRDIALEGFTADKQFSGSGNTRNLTLSNIKGVGTNKFIRITGGTAVSSDGQGSNPVTSSAFSIVEKDLVDPVLTISDPNPVQVSLGGTVSYTLIFTDNVEVIDIDLIETDLALQGFTADVTILGTGKTSRFVTLSNVQGEIGGDKLLRVSGGVALDVEGNGSNSGNSPAFMIIEEPSKSGLEKLLESLHTEKALIILLAVIIAGLLITIVLILSFRNRKEDI